MGAAAYRSLHRWTSMSTGWAIMPLASEGVSPTMSASTRGGSQIPPSLSPQVLPSQGSPCTGPPPRRCVVGLGWLPARLPGCSRQPLRAVTPRASTHSEFYSRCVLGAFTPGNGPVTGPVAGRKNAKNAPNGDPVKSGTVKCPVCRAPNRTSWDLPGTDPRFLGAESYGSAFIFSRGQNGHKRILYRSLPGYPRMQAGEESDTSPRHGHTSPNRTKRGKGGGKGRARVSVPPVPACNYVESRLVRSY
jgi:hypothetical protein